MTYEPDIAIPPGETIREAMKAQGMSWMDFAICLGRGPAFTAALLRGEQKIMAPLAEEIETMLGIQATFLLELERNYRATLARLVEKEKIP